MRAMRKILSLLLLLAWIPAVAVDDPSNELSAANFKKCPNSLWPTEKAGQIPPGVVQLRVNLGTDGKVLEAAHSISSAKDALERSAQAAVLGCVADAALMSHGAGWYNLRYVWGLQTSIKGLEREAMRELMDDAVNGDVESQLAMAVQYRSNQRFLSDASEAMAWLTRSAQAGSAVAQLALAIAYANGERVSEDQTKATFWYGRAAQAGNTVAQHLYAVQLELGLGSKVDLAAAITWYRKAAAGGSAEAKIRLTKEKP